MQGERKRRIGLRLIEHEGERDRTNHVGGKGHTSKLRNKSTDNPISEVYAKQDSAADKLARKAKVKFTAFWQNTSYLWPQLHHLGLLIRASFQI